MIINDDFNYKKLNRKFYGFEILKEYYDKIKDREDNYE